MRSEIRESRQVRVKSVSKCGRRFRGAAAEADRLVEIKELKIDGHSEKFKDWGIAGFFFYGGMSDGATTAVLMRHLLT